MGAHCAPWLPASAARLKRTTSGEPRAHPTSLNYIRAVSISKEARDSKTWVTKIVLGNQREKLYKPCRIFRVKI
jgi:hypothetical protein